MLISRGPVYHTNGDTAGWEHGTDKLEKLILDQDFDTVNELMNKWHPGCTCVAVPVYKYDNYPTQEQEEAAFEIYKRARKRVAHLMRVNESKNNTRLILNAMRQEIYSPSLEQDATTLPRNVA
jgi:RNase H-fold protein (predicted Holliday junction resolvase)